jgi:flagellar basal-body rod modification protein FlgD
MNPINTNPTASATGATAATPATSASKSLLDKDAFLKLMMVQLEHQDPLAPSDPSQFIGQLSQLTTLEQTTNMAASSAKTATAENTVAALALLNHSVTYTDAQGSDHTGTVQKVELTTGGPQLTIDGISGIDPSSVSEVS